MPTTDAERLLSSEYNAWTDLLARSADIVQPQGSNVPSDNALGQVLERAALTGFVNSFEIYLTDLMSEIYLTHPLTLKSGATVTVEEVLNFQTMLEFVDFEANRRISKLTRGAIEAYVETFRRQYQLEIFTAPEQPRARELFEIRNLYTHHSGRVDAKFQANNPSINLPRETLYQMSVDDILSTADFLASVVSRLDQAAVAKYQLKTITT